MALILVALLLIAGGAYLLTHDRADAPKDTAITTPSPSPTPNPVPAETPSVNEPDAFITLSDSGYSPASITIKKGDVVRFINNSNRDFWPASAIHPTHSVYPIKTSKDCLGSAFDACRAIEPGGAWEFRFDEAGTWRYHDHLSASKTGSVVVLE